MDLGFVGVVKKVEREGFLVDLLAMRRVKSDRQIQCASTYDSPPPPGAVHVPIRI